MTKFESRLISALNLEVPYFERHPFEAFPTFAERQHRSIPASVLILFGFFESDIEQRRDPQLLITRRSEVLEKHRGQMAFPGGVGEKHETKVQSALRETEEEVGISPSQVNILGELPGLWTITDFWVTPVLGVLKSPIEVNSLVCSANEIAEAFWVPLSTLRDPQIYREEFIQRDEIRYATHVYTVKGHRIWGATGTMIKNLLDRLVALP